MIGAMGMAYEEAAAICEVAEGTIKSRVSRGRLRLAGILGLQAGELPETVAKDPLPPRLRRFDEPLRVDISFASRRAG